MIYEACFDSRRGSGNDVNCFFFSFCKDCWRWNKMEVGDEGWRSNIPYGLFFSLFYVWVWVWSFMHQMSELRVGFLFLWGGLVDHDDHHSRPRCSFEKGGSIFCA